MTAILHALRFLAEVYATLAVIAIGWLLWAARHAPHEAEDDVILIGPLREVSIDEALGRIAANEAEDWLRDHTNGQVVEDWRGESA